MSTISLTPPRSLRAPMRRSSRRSHVRAFARVAVRGVTGSVRVFCRDVGHGLVDVSHNMLALLGLLLAAAVIFAVGQRDLRHDAEAWTLGWLKARQLARTEPVVPAIPDAAAVLAEQLREPDAVSRATASDLKELNRQQVWVAQWLSRRYHVAPEPIGRLVQEAWRVGQKAGLDPTLILAIMAVESSFNPFAQSTVGAQGLMQVMTKVHNEKYEAFGGNHAAFDPVTNLRVGVQVLKECIARAGGIDAGLRSYVGAGPAGDDGGYAVKVLSEQSSLRLVANGRNVSPQQRPVVAATPKSVVVPNEPGKDDAERPEAAASSVPEQMAFLSIRR